jgi:hypothetical protein
MPPMFTWGKVQMGELFAVPIPAPPQPKIAMAAAKIAAAIDRVWRGAAQIHDEAGVP